METNRHLDKIAIVSGAGSGIGRATAQRLVREGATVVACDVNEAGLEGLVAEAGHGERVHTVVADLTQDDAVSRVSWTARDISCHG